MTLRELTKTVKNDDTLCIKDYAGNIIIKDTKFDIIPSEYLDMPIIKYHEYGTRFCGKELPKGYETQGHMEVISYPLTQRIHIEVKATKGNCMIHYQTGESYIYEKKRFQMPYMFEQPQNSRPQNDTGAWYATPQSLTDDIDSIAASILGKKVKGKDYCDLSENMSRRIEEEYRNSIQEFISNIQFAMSLSAVPLGICIRKYLLDGGIGVYEDKDRILAVCINRQGFEIDTINAAGIYENISDRPFGQAETDMNTPIASAEWKMPLSAT